MMFVTFSRKNYYIDCKGHVNQLKIQKYIRYNLLRYSKRQLTLEKSCYQNQYKKLWCHIKKNSRIKNIHFFEVSYRVPLFSKINTKNYEVSYKEKQSYKNIHLFEVSYRVPLFVTKNTKSTSQRFQ